MSGRSPLRWAIESLRVKHDKASGTVDDPNRWHVWHHEPFELIRHLRRLVAVSVETARIVAALPWRCQATMRAVCQPVPQTSPSESTSLPWVLEGRAGGGVIAQKLAEERNEGQRPPGWWKLR